MEFYKQILPVAVDRKEKKNIVKALSKDYNAVTAGADSVVGALMGSVSMQSAPNTWEVFRDKYSGCILYVMIPQHNNHIEAGCIAHRPSEKRVFEQFKANIKKVLGEERDVSSVRWRQFLFLNDSFRLISSDSSGRILIDGAKPEVAASLMEPSRRSVLRMIGEAGQISAEKIISVFPDCDMFSVTDELVGLGLISRSFNVHCRETGNLISRVNDIEFIRDASSRGLQCPFCGKTFLDERIEQIFTITEEGRRFWQRNYWLSLFTVCMLMESGVYHDNIAVVQENSFENTDVFVSHFGKLIYVSVKESPLSDDAVFLFSERSKFYGADKTVLVTDSALSPQSRSFLEKAVPGVSVIDSVANLSESLKGVLDGMKAESASDSVALFGPIAGVDITSTVADFFFKERRDELVESLADTDVPDHSSLRIADKSSDNESIDDDELIEEVISSQAFYSETEEPEIPMEDLEIEDEQEQAEQAEDQAEQPEEQASEAALDPERDAQSGGGEDDYYHGYADIEDDGDETEDELLITEAIKVDFNGAENDAVSIPELSPSDRAFEEARAAVCRSMASLVESGDLSASAMDEALAGMGDSAALYCDDSGLAVSFVNMAPERAAALSAYGTELICRLSEGIDVESGIGGPVSFFMDAPGRVVSFSGLKSGSMFFESPSSSDSSDLSAVSAPDVRYLIAEKVFDKIKTIESVDDLVLIDENGDIAVSREDGIKSQERLRLCLDLLRGSWDLLREVCGGESPRQFCLITEYTIYSFIFFGDGTVFAALVDSAAGREIWNLKLMESARLIA